jgi:hypothetical protein
VACGLTAVAFALVIVPLRHHVAFVVVAAGLCIASLVGAVRVRVDTRAGRPSDELPRATPTLKRRVMAGVIGIVTAAAAAVIGELHFSDGVTIAAIAGIVVSAVTVARIWGR